MYKVQYKPHNASQAWHTKGTYNNDSSALGSAGNIAGKYFMVRVVDKNGSTIWSA